MGQTFSVRIMVTSPQAVNAVSATLAFPRDLVQVTSVSKIGSILNLWVEEPSFSNSAGTVSLEGVVPNPGFVGASGPVVTVNFKVVAPGMANLKFSAGSLLANDGYGTNILKNRGTASYGLENAPVTPAEVVPAPQEEVVPTYVDLNASNAHEEEPVPSGKMISIRVPKISDIYDWLLKILSFVIPLVALFFLLTHTTKRGIANLRSLRKDLHDIDRLVEKSFDLIKDDMADSIRMLEKARTRRKLTDEEDAIIRRLRQNLADAEKVIHKQVLQTERDIGD